MSFYFGRIEKMENVIWNMFEWKHVELEYADDILKLFFSLEKGLKFY